MLLYLADSGKNHEVAAISSVSGGSILNGVVAHETDFRTAEADEFESEMRPLVRHVADVGLFLWGPSTNAYVLSVLGLAGLSVVALAAGLVLLALNGLDLASGLMLLGALVIFSVALLWFGRRSVVVDRALAKTHFRTGGKPTRLAAIERSVDHVFCATELQRGGHVYMSPRFFYGYPFGLGTPGELALSTAVQASACLPGAFAARRLPTAAYGLTGSGAAELVLTDGGVYDNMADQWFTGLERRLEGNPGLPLVSDSVDELIVVNASAGHPWRELKRARIPLIREVNTLNRVNSVMYEVSTRRRRLDLVEDWERDGARTRGALVHIAQSPYVVAGRYRNAPGGRGERARAVLALLGDDADAWKARAEASSAVKTVLRKLERRTSAALLEHSYVLAMCNLHVLLGYPLLALPAKERFEALTEPAVAQPVKVAALA